LYLYDSLISPVGHIVKPVLLSSFRNLWFTWVKTFHVLEKWS